MPQYRGPGLPVVNIVRFSVGEPPGNRDTTTVIDSAR
jgi:hypothetical protein